MIKGKPLHQPAVKMARVAPVKKPKEQQLWGRGRGKSGSDWAKTRERIMRRDGGLCQCAECKGFGRVELAHEVDHIDNRRGDGYDADSNLQAINRECHRRKTTLEIKIAKRKAKRPPHMDRTTWMPWVKF